MKKIILVLFTFSFLFNLQAQNISPVQQRKLIHPTGQLDHYRAGRVRRDAGWPEAGRAGRRREPRGRGGEDRRAAALTPGIAAGVQCPCRGCPPAPALRPLPPP